VSHRKAPTRNFGANLLRQFQQAQADVLNAGRTLAGQVSIGLAPGTAALALALPLLQAVHARHPQIVLHLNEDFGTTLCDVVRNGRMDMAVLYGGVDATPGLSFEPLLTEELFVVARPGMLRSNAKGRGVEQSGDVSLADLAQVDLLLPCTGNQLRRYLDQSFASSRIAPRVVAEMESSNTLAAAIASGIGATLLPVSAARAVAATADAQMNRFCASFSIGATSSSGTTAHPSRQPVMLKYFEKLLTEITSSPHCSALWPNDSSKLKPR